MGMQLPRCAVIIPTYNGAILTRACLESLLTSPPTECTWDIIVVDDGSTEDTIGILADYASSVHLVALTKNQGFARACNAGAREAEGCDFLVFLNNDTIVTPGWLDSLIREASTTPRLSPSAPSYSFLTERSNTQAYVSEEMVGQDIYTPAFLANIPQ